MADFLTNRGGVWTYNRRVPLAFAELDKRAFVRQTTKLRVADDPRGIKARRIADRINTETEAYWRGLVEGQAAEAKRRYDAARRRARAFGFDYATAVELAERPVVEILDRIERLVQRRAVDDHTAVAAVLGGESPPEIMLSGLFDEYEAASRASIADLSEDQRRKWRNPKKRALANLITVVSDKPLHRITRGDALDFQTWWQDRILSDGVEIGTANKDIGHINRMLRIVDKRHRIGLAPLFGDLRIEGETERSRQAFTAAFVRDRILAAGALDGLNDEARDILLIIAETGLRLSEAANLGRGTIVLNAEIPHARVMPDGRRMKTPQSERDVPLVGVALAAAARHPDGFPRYHDNAATLSATVNKYLTDRSLRPTREHTLYSLRHTFEDRLTAVEAPEKLVAALMGHKFHRPKYGSGPSLKQKAEWLHRIAFKLDSTV
ncbi:integrase [uncultured Enterovirga sp.]|uniref:integrase n=1 Tax=uncultured Enterovirga sp. TaxID=2026352 RepID=UPI0035CB5237